MLHKLKLKLRCLFKSHKINWHTAIELAHHVGYEKLLTEPLFCFHCGKVFKVGKLLGIMNTRLISLQAEDLDNRLP